MKAKNSKKGGRFDVKTTPTNVYQIVTDRITEQLAKGEIPWHKPWVGGGDVAISYASRKPYSFLNQMLLGKPGEWLSWGLIQKLGGRVKKGAKSSICVWTKCETVLGEKENEDGETEVTRNFRRYLKWYRVWHLDDVEGIESKIEKVVPNPDITPVEAAEKIVNDYVERERAGGFTFINNRESGQAYYSPSEDKVVVPMISQYEIVEEYYSTTFHELTHSTMHEKRCDRKSENKLAAFGDANYSREELVAEFGAAFLCNRAGLDNEKAFKNNVAYIQNWLKALKDDNRMIAWAASRAQKAARYILGEKEEVAENND